MAWKVETLIRVSIFHKGDSVEKESNQEEEEENMQFIHLFLSFFLSIIKKKPFFLKKKFDFFDFSSEL